MLLGIAVDLRRAQVGLVAACGLSLAIAAAAAGEETGEPSSKVLVASTEASAETLQTLPITREARGEVVASLRPDAVPDLQPGDQLEVSAEVEVTTDCLRRNRKRENECRGKAYRFNPRIGARLVLNENAGAIEGVPLSPRTESSCRQRLTAREHHCYISLTSPPVLVSEQTLPCVTGTCRINLVMDASNPQARRGNVVLLGGNKGKEKVKQDKASIDVVRIRPPEPSEASPSLPNGTTVDLTTEPMIDGLSLDHPPRKAVVYSQRLEDLREGDQLAARARMFTGIRQLRHNANISARIVLADGPLNPNPVLGEGEMAKEEGEITENNGLNCTQPTTPCVTVKAGVLKVERDYPGSLYINLVLSVGRVGGRAPGDNLVTVQDGGHLEVVRYPAAQKG